MKRKVRMFFNSKEYGFLPSDDDRKPGVYLRPASDNVNHPSHYETGRFECIDVMLETQGKEAVQSFCICNAFKYLYRRRRKNGIEDIKKAIWYLNKFIELEESLCMPSEHGNGPEMVGPTLTPEELSKILGVDLNVFLNSLRELIGKDGEAV